MMCSGLAMGGPIFFDNFNSENGGVGKLNYNTFNNWTVSNGTVDLIGNDFYQLGIPTSYGLFVDMDGSTGDAGKMTSKNISLAAGTYTLQFELAGNQRNKAGESVTVQVSAGTFLNKSYTLPQTAPFTLYSETFLVSTPTTVNLSFEGIGGDNIGMLLDNVALSPVPVPGALLLGSLGVGVVGYLRRRRSL
jgi:hypothetical protein